MRKAVLVAVLAITAGSVSGCLTNSSGDEAAGAATATPLAPPPPGQPGTTGGSGLSGNTSGTGGPNVTTLTTGSTALAFSPNGRSPQSGGLVQLDHTNKGNLDDVATISVDPANTLGWGGAVQLPVFRQNNTGQLGSTQYTEYRRIANGSDTELQFWQFGESEFGQYRDVTGGGTDAAFAAWFFDGNAADPASLPGAGSVVYNGEFTATAEASNWLQIDGGTYSPNGFWRLRGTTTVSADFGTGNVEGNLVSTYWEKFDNGTLVQVNNINSAAPTPERYIFQDTTFHVDATIDAGASTYSGSTQTIVNQASNDTPLNPHPIANPDFINGDNPALGGFFGAGGSETAGVFAVFSKLPAPSGGDIGINDDRRGNIDVQGGFHGN